jgi:NitT/TauT family transport system substrate-binding protein
MRLALPDLISNSYFPAIAAVELGLFRDEGLDMTLELISPVDRAYEAMRDGTIDFVAGSAHGVLATFPRWQGAKLLAALSQGMYWLLILRADLGAAPGDVAAVMGLRIGAAPVVQFGLRGLLLEAGIDPDREVEIVRVPGTAGPTTNFGVTAAEALEAGKIDGFWANAMGAEVAIQRGAGTKVLDVRRGLGPKSAFHYTAPVLVATDALIEREPEACAAAARAIARALDALKADPDVATRIAERVFPPGNTALIAELIRRDLPYYDPGLSPTFITAMNAFARRVGLLDIDVPYEGVVASVVSTPLSA